MKVEKKVISHLNKCYSMCELTYRGERCFLVAAEKRDPCYLFSEDGVQLETVWTDPGGVMTMAQVPERTTGKSVPSAPPPSSTASASCTGTA